MAVGAIAAGTYGIPRATKDIDPLVSTDSKNGIHQLRQGLGDVIEFDNPSQFDTLTWGRRYVGVSRNALPYKVEPFEIFDDAFVQSEFARRKQTFVPLLGAKIWLPTAEDVIVRKIRWGRSKDLDDARDVLAVQGIETLDMSYIKSWCATHETDGKLEEILRELPEF